MKVQIPVAAEHGSNSYGEYWKFPDGLLICIGRINKNVNIHYKTEGGYYDDSYTINFPYSFKDKSSYHVNFEFVDKRFVLFIYSVTNTNSTQCDINLFAHSVVDNVVTTLSFMAIGRWK